MPSVPTQRLEVVQLLLSNIGKWLWVALHVMRGAKACGAKVGNIDATALLGRKIPNSAKYLGEALGESFVSALLCQVPGIYVEHLDHGMADRCVTLNQVIRLPEQLLRPHIDAEKCVLCALSCFAGCFQ